MGIKKKLYKVLSLFIVFSMLSNYMFICSEITDVVFATEFEAGFSSSLELNTNTSDEEIINSEEEFESENLDNEPVSEEKILTESIENEVSEEVSDSEELLEAEENNSEVIENVESDENFESDEELEIVEDTDSSDFVMPENNIEQYLVDMDYNINRVSKFDNSFGKGVIIDGTFSINVNAQKKHDVKIELNLPQIFGVSPIKYKIEELDDNISILHNVEENRMTFNITEAVSSQAVRIVFLYDETAYNGEDIKITGTIVKTDYANEDIQNDSLNDFIDKDEIKDDINNINTIDNSPLFETREYINIESALTKRFSTAQEISNIEDEVIEEQNKEEVIETNNDITEELVDEQEVKEEFEINKKIEFKVESIGSYSLKTDVPSRFKGMLYANLSVKNSKDFNYVTTDTIEVEDKDFIDSIEIESKDKIINKENEEMNIQNNIFVKRMIIAEEQYDAILGENGYIEIYDGSNTKIGILDKDSNKENGKYIYEFPSLINNVKYRLVDAENNGSIDVKFEKIIPKDLKISREEILDIDKILTENANRTIKSFDDKEVALQEIATQTEMKLVDTQTEITLDFDNNTLSTQKENEVLFNINLKTNSEEYETYKNPIIELVFPHSIQDVQIDNISLLHKNGLSLENWGVEKDEFGDVILKVQLLGDQEEYNPSTIIEGTTINLVTKVIADRLTTEETGNIKLRYSNENSTKIAYEAQGKDSEEYEIKYVSNSELLTVINLDNFNSNLDVLSEINADRLVGKADVGGERKTTSVSLNVINNFKEDMENVVIIGRLPVVGNIDNNGNSLNTTIDANLASSITTSGLLTKVYYSEELNEDINSDNWTENVTDLSKVKCFKIEVSNGMMHQGENIDINYNLYIPENLDYNQSIYGLDTIHYKVDGIDKTKDIVLGLETEEKEVTIEDFENIQNTEKLRVGTKVTRGGEEITDGENVNERQTLRYTTIIENISNEPINNIVLKGNAHNANMYYWHTYTVISSSDGEEVLTGEWIEDRDGTHTSDSLEIESLKPGESKIFEYQVVVNDLTLLQDHNDKQVYGNITIQANGIDEQKIETIKNPIINAELEIQLEKNGLEDATNMIIEAGESYFLRVYLKNLTDKTLENFEVNLNLPSFIHYDPIMEVAHDEYIVSTRETSTSNIVTVLVEKLEPGEETFVFFYTKVSEFDVSILSLNSTVVADATVNNRRYVSNDYSRVISQSQTFYDIDFVGNKEDGSKVEDGEELEYAFTAKNAGALKERVLFEYFFPLGLDINSIDLYHDDNTKENLYTKMAKTESTEKVEEVEETEIVVEPEDEIKNDFEVNEEEEINRNNEDTTTYVDDIYENLDPNETFYYEGYNEGTNIYTKSFEMASLESVKIIIKATVDLSKGIEHQESIVNTVNFRGEPIEKSVTYYIDYPEEPKEPEEAELIPEDDTPPEIPIEEDVVNSSVVEEDMAPDDVVIEEIEEVPDVVEETIPEEETISDNQVIEENEENTVQEEVEKVEEVKETVSTNTTSNTIIETSDTEIKEDNNSNKAIILNSARQPVLNSPSRNIEANNENVASLFEKENEETHSISGTVWVDENKDGIPNNKENKIPNLKVQLYTEDGKNAIKTTTTNKIGEYSFSNISKGNYVVIFSYDNDLYNINPSSTQDNTETLSIISSKIIDGTKYGISDTINIEDSDITGLNMGLKPNDKFDLSVKTYVSKMKVKTSKGTEEYSFDENDLSKVEIPSKNISGAEVTVTFISKITNNGNVSGYVTALKNDTNGEWTFNQAQNKNWVVGEDGSLYNLQLENVPIEPEGEIEVKLILTKTMSEEDTGIFTNIVKISGKTNEYQLQDINTENDESNTEFMISIKTGAKTYVIIGIVAILVFIILLSIINLKLLDKVDEKGKRKINIILILLFILLMIAIYAIKSEAHVYPNRFNSGEVGEVLYKWCIGFNLGDFDDLGAHATYQRLDSYLTNYYGAASTRQAFLNKKWRYTQDNAARTRTNVCMHCRDITPVGYGTRISLSMFNSCLRAYSAVDSGYSNNTWYDWPNTMYGDYVSGLYTRGTPNKMAWKTTTWEAQTMAYIAWAVEKDIWRSAYDRSRDEYKIYHVYKDALPNTMMRYKSFNQAITDVSGVFNHVDRSTFDCQWYVDTFKSNISTFNTQNATVFGTTSNNISQNTLNVKDNKNNTYLSIETVGNKDYVTGIVPVFPVAGNNDNIKNRVYIEYSRNAGKTWTRYTGNVYVKSGNSLVAKAQNSTYGLNTTASASSNPFLKKQIYIPSSVLGSNLPDFRVRIRNCYYTYYARTIYMIKGGFDQCQGITRGARWDATRSQYIYRLGDGLDADKHAAYIDGVKYEAPNNIYAETGSTVRYSIKFTNTGGRALKNIKFTDTEHSGQDYIRCSSNITTSDGGKTFTYSGTINPKNSVTAWVEYKVTKHFESTVQKVNNTLEVTNIQAYNGGNVYTKGNSSTTLMSTKKLRATSEWIYIKVYKPTVNKYIYKIDSTATTNRKTNKKTALYADYGSTVIFAIDIANEGDKSGQYGNIKDFVIDDLFNNAQLKYEGAHSSKTTTYMASGKSENWTITNNSANSRLTFSYSGTLTPGDVVRIYVKFKNIAIATDSINVKNTARITSIKSKFNYVIEENRSAPGKVFKSSDSFGSKTYNAKIDKRVNLAGSWVKSRYAEVGDEIIYRISVINERKSGAAGNVNNIVIKDLLSNNVRGDDKNYLEFEGFQGNSTTQNGYVMSGTSGGWTISAVSKNGFIITCNNSVAPGKTSNVYIKFKVKHGDTVNRIITNQAERIETKNPLDIEVNEFTSGTKKSSANVTLKIYSANVLKYIYSISGERVLPDRSKDKSQEVTIEGGDIVVFKIVVTNDGTNADKYGVISNFELLETYPKMVFELTNDQNYGTNWTKSGDKFVFNGSLAPNKSTTLTIKLKVVGLDPTLEKDENGDIKVENIASLENQVVKNKNKENINGEPNKILNGKLTDSDSAVLLITRVEIAKFITKLNNVSIADRSEKTNDEKFNDPVEVEKNNGLLYRIEIKNVGRTVISKMTYKDTLDSGIEFDGDALETAKLYTGDTDTTGTDIKSKITFTGNASARDIVYDTDFEAEQKIVLEFKCKVTITNLHLLNLKNEFSIVSMINKVNFEIYNTPFLDLKRYDNEDFVRLKDLIVSGTIWLDENLNGLIDDEEPGIPDMKVILNDVTNGKKAITFTDENGKYSFTETNGEAARDGATNLDQKMVLSDNRVVKATNKNQQTGNYDDTSNYIRYYLSYEYNGGKYETTPPYANDNNIEKANNTYITPYERDSNAAEFENSRVDFNNRLETISYNLATSTTGSKKILEYDKNGHESIINIENDTAASMFAYSFANIGENGSDGIQDGDLRYLWFLNGSNSYDGETEYLKYINMGLTERRFDLRIEQDVYSVKNTINGQSMTYNFNQREVSSEFGGEYVLGGEREDYKNPYQFNLYNSDYYYNPNMYTSEDVRNYKQNTTLNTEITYKVKVTNEKVDDNKDVYAIINEIADYYSNIFMKVNNTKIIKELNDEGFLENIDPALNTVEAWCEDGTNKIYLTVSDKFRYGEAKNFGAEDYSTLYITGFRDSSSNSIKLKEGDSFEFYIKFIVDNDNTGKIKLGEANTVVEINSYSTYKDTDEPAGYIDRDSNPGNVSRIDRIDEYEDDNFRAGIDLILGSKERTVSGFVWDDSRTEKLEETDVTSLGMSNPHNSSISGNNNEGFNTNGPNLSNTSAISGSYTQYYADGKYDTSVKKNNDGKTNAKVTEILSKNEDEDLPVQDVRATMVEVIKIKDESGQTRYYEEKINPWLEGGSPSSLTDENGIYTLTSFIPGKYETHFEYGYAVGENVSQNMQVFNGHDYKSTIYNSAIDSKTADDDILEEMKKEGLSDARDDEIRRLEVISYSEKMTNRKVENIQRTSTELSEREFAEDTAMEARTNEFKIKTEDVAGNSNTFSYDAYMSLVSGMNVRYKVDNIDFGIEYRPETSLLLKKYISNIKVVLSTGEDLINIKYNYIYENGPNTKITGTAIDKANSIGADNLQELRTVRYIKGFEYVNVDTDILQGAKVEIEYLLVASNESEIDRISRNLNGLMYREDADTSYTIYMENDYTASGTAKNQLIAEYYGDTYNTNNKSRIKDLNMYNGTTGYYGKYVGSMYYTGNKGNDVVAKLKVDKILDYVDTDIEFHENENHSEDNYWQTINSTTLIDDGYIRRPNSGELVDPNGIKFSVNDNEDGEMSNLAISVNDRTSVSDADVINKSISKYLYPSEVTDTGNFGIIKLMTSKVLASETDTDNMKYDNTSEIIQYTSQTGRATQMKTESSPLGQTLGNVDPSSSTPPEEPDTSFTETITLSPPTGLDKANYYFRVYIDYVLISMAIVAVTSGGIFTGRKIKNYKKFYK